MFIITILGMFQLAQIPTTSTTHRKASFSNTSNNREEAIASRSYRRTAILLVLPVKSKISIARKLIVAPKFRPKIAHRRVIDSRKFSVSYSGGIAARIRKCESGGNYHAQNPHSTASGAYQFLNSTWTRLTGTPGPASNYSPATQDAAFWKLWANGAGASNWNPSKSCWG